ncbi:KilA-N domain-containing protein [Paenalcaligenes niemegkensis]|uniref:KilA-N domain-containing protein n=1 Tax=Paenalcaligenes niemegkensis TaxID=2895469 RepID=UPI001EE7F173|nr:KilA-N domain-containing protein [Paenalcaligenes niemegkensis]MCQ9618396.1 KilA-N domain-containing protein [Paenalcaligenes niemegkensis]
MSPLVISNTAVRQDVLGRYCLNDLHRAAVIREKATVSQRPGTFLKRPETIALVKAIKKRCTVECIDPVSTIKGGVAAIQGTYVTKPLVYAYAMWIDADFNLDVIEAFDSLQTNAMTIYKQLQELAAREQGSKLRASFGSRLMLDRKREIPLLETEKERLERELQPELFIH